MKKKQISQKHVLCKINFGPIHPTFTSKLMTACLKSRFLIQFLRTIEYRGVTILSEYACKGGQVTDLDSLFYPDLRKINFRGIFLIFCQIRFFIRIPYGKFSVFYPFSVMAPKNSISNQNPDKKENLARQKYPEILEIPSKFLIKPLKFWIKKRIQARDLPSFTSASG